MLENDKVYTLLTTMAADGLPMDLVVYILIECYVCYPVVCSLLITRLIRQLA